MQVRYKSIAVPLQKELHVNMPSNNEEPLENDARILNEAQSFAMKKKTTGTEYKTQKGHSRRLWRAIAQRNVHPLQFPYKKLHAILPEAQTASLGNTEATKCARQLACKYSLVSSVMF